MHEVEFSPNNCLRDIKSISSRIVECNEDVLSLRLSLVADSINSSFIDTLSKIVKVNELSYISIWLEDVVNLDDVVELLKLSNKIYVSFMYSRDLPFKVSELLLKVYERLGWRGCSRLGLSISEPPQTPYFPVNKPYERGFTVSLLYPKYMLSLLNSGYSLTESLELIAERTLRLCRKLEDKLPFLGVDYSLSPWMDDSVVELVERVGGIKFGNPGTISAIVDINRALQKIANKYDGIGFNEIMLPYAEDNGLKELARQGLLTLKDLLCYTVYCVAGLDMVLVPLEPGIKFVDLMLEDLIRAQALKNKCIGFRLLLINLPPHSEADLGMFGITPVLKLK